MDKRRLAAQRLGKEGKCIVSFIPTCPNGHTMELRVSRRRSGDMYIWDALYRCRCGWDGPKISSTDLNIATREAMERTGIALVPDDHIMSDKEVKEFVRNHIIRRS